MPTNIIEPSKMGDIRLGVTVSGLDVTVQQGGFFMHENGSKVDYALAEDYDHTVVPDPDEDTAVIGYLAERESDGVVVVVTDEVSESDGQLFDWGGSGYRILHNLWTVQVPAAAASLDVANLSIYHFHGHE